MVGNVLGSRNTVGTKFTWVLVVTLVLSSATALGWGAGPAGAASSTTKACKSLLGVQDDLSNLSRDITPGSFDGELFSTIGAAFAKAARSAPKAVKGSLHQLAKLYKAVGNTDSAVEAGIELSKSGQKYAKATEKFAKFFATKCVGASGGSSTGASSSGSSAGGTLVLAGVTIPLETSRCALKEQTAAGQDIELTAQANGTNDAGDTVMIDFTRYAEGGQFEGDDISVDVGAVGSSDAVRYHTRLDHGAVDRSGDTFSVDDVELRGDEGPQVSMSFDIEC